MEGEDLSPLEELPTPILEDILERLPPREASGCTTVCRAFKQALQNSGAQWGHVCVDVTSRGSNPQRTSARIRELLSWSRPKAKHAKHLALTLDSRAGPVADAVLITLRDLRVLQLRVRGNLQGLPRGMTALKGLLELYVVAQDFSGGLATWIEGFSELHTLDIRLDSTSDPYIAGGPLLPTCITALANLRRVRLHHCRLREVPGMLGRLGLEELHIVGADLHTQTYTGSYCAVREGQFTAFNRCFAKCAAINYSLRSLTLRECQQSCLPAQLSQLKGLTALDVSHNSLRSFSVEELRHLTALRHLNLAGNQVGLVPKVLHSLSLLEFVDLSHNPPLQFQEGSHSLEALIAALPCLTRLGLEQGPQKMWRDESLSQLRQLALALNDKPSSTHPALQVTGLPPPDVGDAAGRQQLPGGRQAGAGNAAVVLHTASTPKPDRGSLALVHSGAVGDRLPTPPWQLGSRTAPKGHSTHAATDIPGQGSSTQSRRSCEAGAGEASRSERHVERKPAAAAEGKQRRALVEKGTILDTGRVTSTSPTFVKRPGRGAIGRKAMLQ